MPKLKGQYVGKLVSYAKEDPECDLAGDVGHIGYVKLFESLSLYPGTHFVRFFFSSEDGDLGFTDRYLTTACGDLELTEDRLVISNTRSRGNTFVFELHGEVAAEALDLK